MENASKALIMAGAVLISIMIASFFIFVLKKGASMSAEYDSQMSDTELANFNGQFEIYDRDDNTYFDVVTVINLAYDINKRNGYDPQNGVRVELSIPGTGVETGKYLLEISPDIQKNCITHESVSENAYIYDSTLVEKNTEREQITGSTEYKYKYVFRCDSIKYSPTTGKVNEITFKRVENN